MRVYKLVALLSLFLALVKGASLKQDEGKVRYDNHTVYKIQFSNPVQRQLLLQLTKRHQSVSVSFDIQIIYIN